MTRARKGQITVALNTLAGRILDENSLIDGGFIRYNQTNNNFVYYNLINNLSEGYLPVFSSNTFANSPIHISSGEVSVITPLILEKTTKYNIGYTPTGSEVTGESYWDSDNMTYSDVLLNGVTGQRYQEDYWIIKNTSGSIIENGAAVMFDGVVGASGKFKGTAAIADGSKPAMFILGIATQQIAINAWGYITARGSVREINTTGAPYGEIWNEEDILYVSPTIPGHLTNIKPQAPNLEITVAVVAVKSSSIGELIVRPTWNPKLTELSDVDGTPVTTTGQFPVWHQDTQVFDFDYNINDYLPKSAIDSTKGVTGWLDGDNINVSYNFTNRTVTLTHSSGKLEYVYRGDIRELGTGGTWTSSPHTATVSNWFLFSTDGLNFIWAQSSWEFADIMVAFVRYGGTNTSSWCVRETHGTMDYKSHEEFHTQIGTYRTSGGTITDGTYAFNTATNAAVTPGFDPFVLKDEDVSSSEPAWLEGTYTTMYVGPSGTSVFSTTESWPFLAAGANQFIYVNDIVAGTLTPGINNRFYNVYQLLVPVASDSDSQKYRVIMIQPQATFSTLAGAQAEDIRGISLGQFSSLSPEFVAYVRITYNSGTGYTNYGKVVIPTGGISYVVGNKMGQITVGGFTGNSHSSLTDLSWIISGHMGTASSLAAFDASGIATNILLNTIVQTSGAQSISGTKTFTDSPIVPYPTGGTHAANKNYADTKVTANAAITAATKTKITYDTQGLVTFGENAGISDITGLQTALDGKAPATGSTAYIQNQNASAQSANMWISGSIEANRDLYLRDDGTNQKILSLERSGNSLTLLNNGGIGLLASSVAPLYLSGEGVNSMQLYANSIQVSKQLQSTVATGTAPFTVASTTMVSNLNADLLDGLNEGDFFRYLGAGIDANDVRINSSGYTYGVGSPFYGSVLTFGIPNYQGQIQVNAGSPNTIHFRNQIGGTWSDWNTLYHTGNLTNPVTGTGTANYIPKWGVGETSLTGTSNIYDDGTNVGIGINTPDSKLSISHTANSTNPALRITSSGTLANNNIVRFQINGLTNGFVMRQDESSNVIYEFNTGRLGININEPTEYLDVNGNARFRSIGTGTLSSLLGVTSDGTLTTATGGALGTLLIGQGTTTAPTWGSVNAAIGGNALSSGYFPYWDGSKLVNSNLVYSDTNVLSLLNGTRQNPFTIASKNQDNTAIKLSAGASSYLKAEIILNSAWDGSQLQGGSIDFITYSTERGKFTQDGYFQVNNLAGTNTRLVTASSTGQLGNIANSAGYLYNDGSGNYSYSAIDLSNYYTKTNLQTSGQASVHWDNITNEPAFLTGTKVDSFNTRTGVVTLTKADVEGVLTGAITSHTHAYEPANANIQSHISSTSNPHGVTASQVNLGNVTNLSLSNYFNNSGFAHSGYTDFDTPTDFGYRYIQGTANGPGIPNIVQYYSWGIGLGSDYGYSSYASQFAFPRFNGTVSPYLTVRQREGGTWGGWTKIYAGYADTAGSATPNNDSDLVHKSGTETITGTKTFTATTYYDHSESINLYGIRGRFTNSYIHLYNKVGIGNPGGWGTGESSTPGEGLSTYGGANFAYNSGSVAIGHISPQAKLDVRRANSTDDGVASIIFGSATYYMGALGENTATDDVFLANHYTGGGASLDFRIGGMLAANSKMKINSDGNVGIGIDPVSKLHVNGKGLFGTTGSNANNQGISIANNTGEITSLFLWQNGVASGHIGFAASSNDLYITNSTASGSIIESSNIRLKTTGFMGVGVDPIQKIHTDGTIRAGVYYAGADRDFVEIVPHGTDTRIRSINERFHVTNETGYLVLQETGSHVGIKTNAPSEALSVVGNIAFGNTEGKAKMIYNSTEVSIDFIIN